MTVLGAQPAVQAADEQPISDIQGMSVIDTALAIGAMADWITPLSELTAVLLFGYTLIFVPTVPGIAPIQIIWYLQENGISIIGADLDFAGEWLYMAVDDPERAYSLTEWCW